VTEQSGEGRRNVTRSSFAVFAGSGMIASTSFHPARVATWGALEVPWDRSQPPILVSVTGETTSGNPCSWHWITPIACPGRAEGASPSLAPSGIADRLLAWADLACCILAHMFCP